MPHLTALPRSLRPWLTGLLITTALLGAAPALAQKQQKLFPTSALPKRPDSKPLDTKGEFLLRADEVLYDRNNDMMVARGQVEISQGQRIMMADLVTYDRKNQVVSATGNVVLMEPSGDVLFAEQAEITDDMRDGLIRNFRALLFDNSRMAAATAQRIDGNRKEMTKAVFSPCNLCKDDPKKAPLWQLKGERVTHDEEHHEITYRDATLEMWGVPVFYVPYFSHPDPSVERRSGFLLPTIGRSDQLGVIFGMPYYGIIDDSSDFTLEPRGYSSEGALVAGEVRKRFNHGNLRVAGSLLNGRRVEAGEITDDRTWRGSIAAEGRFDLDENWRAGFDVNRATDRTYLRRFKIGSDYGSRGRYNLPDQLTSAGWVENFTERSYFNASAFAFQSLRPDISSQALPKIHPYAQYQLLGPADRIGGRFQVDSNFLSLTRETGIDSTRLSTTFGYYLPYIGRWGDVWEASASVQADAYSVNDVPLRGDANNLYDGSAGRVHPQFAVNVRYPLIRRQGTNSIMLEPRVGIVVGPNGNNPDKIPNQDSQIFEFDETKLFTTRRFTGYDRVASGSRIDYGLGGGVYGDKGGATTFFVGQSVRNTDDAVYPTGAGLDDKVSDIVGRLSIKPQQWLDLSYRFRLDHDKYILNRQEVAATIFHQGAALSVAYIDYNRDLYTINNRQAETAVVSGVLPLGTLFPAASAWTLYGTYHRDLEAEQTRLARFGVIYRDECFASMLLFERDYSYDADVKVGTSVIFRLGFKYLGDFGG